jgi:hypothetical protein
LKWSAPEAISSANVPRKNRLLVLIPSTGEGFAAFSFDMMISLLPRRLGNFSFRNFIVAAN